MTGAQETYADKIAKLLAKAESTTPEEAELLIAKAQELMQRYAIDQFMVDAARGVEREEIMTTVFRYEGTYRQAHAQIAWEVLRANGCRGVYTDNPTRRIYELEVVGFQSDVDRTRIVETSLQIQAQRALNAWWGSSPMHAALDRNRKFNSRREFLFGFATGTQAALRTANASAQRSAQAAQKSGPSDSVALVLRSRADRVDEWMDKSYGRLRSVNRNYKSGGAGAGSAGRAAGARADVGQPGLKGRGAIGRG
jgi:hypothetical protein